MLNTSNNSRNSSRGGDLKVSRSRSKDKYNLQNSFSSNGSGKGKIGTTTLKSSKISKAHNDNWKERFYQISKDNENLKASLVKERQQNLEYSKKIRKLEQNTIENDKISEKLNKLAENFDRINQDFTQSELIRREQSNLIRSLQNEVEILRNRGGNYIHSNNVNSDESLNKMSPINPEYYLSTDKDRDKRDNILEPEKASSNLRNKSKWKTKAKTTKSKSKEKNSKGKLKSTKIDKIKK